MRLDQITAVLFTVLHDAFVTWLKRRARLDRQNVEIATNLLRFRTCAARLELLLFLARVRLLLLLRFRHTP